MPPHGLYKKVPWEALVWRCPLLGSVPNEVDCPGHSIPIVFSSSQARAGEVQSRFLSICLEPSAGGRFEAVPDDKVCPVVFIQKGPEEANNLDDRQICRLFWELTLKRVFLFDASPLYTILQKISCHQADQTRDTVC